MLGRLAGPYRYPDGPPDGGFGWVVAAGAFSVYVVSVGMQYSQGLLYRALLASPEPFLNSPDSRSRLAWLVSIQSACFLGGGFPAGLLMNTVGVRATILVGALALVLGFLTASFATELFTLLAAFALIGLGCSLPSSAAVVHLQAYFLKRRATATGFAVSGSGAGGLLLGPLVVYVIEASDWRGALRMLALLAALSLPLATLVFVPIRTGAAANGGGGGKATGVSAEVEAETDAKAQAAWAASVPIAPLTPTRTDDEENAWKAPLPVPIPLPQQDLHEAEPEPAATPLLHARLSSYALLSTHRPFQLWFAFASIYGACWFVVLAHSVQAFGESAGTSEVATARLVSLQGGANMFGRVALGLLADKLEGSRGVGKLTILVACVAGVGLATLGLSIPSLASSLSFQACYMALNGLLGGSIVSLQAPIMVGLLGLPSLPTAQGLFHLGQAPWVLCMPPAAGALRTLTGSYSAVWGATGAAMLVAAAVCAAVPSATAERERSLCLAAAQERMERV
jgi:MFS family permease